MANRHRGEIEAVLDGRRWTLCLTLGALAELEAALAAGDLMGLAARFEAGRLSARDAIAIIGAGLRGGGHEIEDGQVARMSAEGGATGYVAIVADLLAATFGRSGGEPPSPPPPHPPPPHPTLPLNPTPPLRA
jgi:hypothetical protein